MATRPARYSSAQGWSYRQLAEKFGVSSSAIGRRAVQECWHGTDAQRANARLRNLAAGLRRQAEQRLAGELDTREIKELTAASSRNMPFDQTPIGDTCVCCGTKADKLIYFARAY